MADQDIYHKISAHNLRAQAEAVDHAIHAGVKIDAGVRIFYRDSVIVSMEITREIPVWTAHVHPYSSAEVVKTWPVGEEAERLFP